MTTFTKVVNLRKDKYSVYIGRQDKPMHYGNPFSIGKSSFSTLVMEKRGDAMRAFFDWLDGTRFQEVEPQRREWILNNLEPLRGQTLGCFCKPNSCHGDVYRIFLGELTFDEVFSPAPVDAPASPAKPEGKASAKTVEHQDDQQMGLF